MMRWTTVKMKLTVMRGLKRCPITSKASNQFSVSPRRYIWRSGQSWTPSSALAVRTNLLRSNCKDFIGRLSGRRLEAIASKIISGVHVAGLKGGAGGDRTVRRGPRGVEEVSQRTGRRKESSVAARGATGSHGSSSACATRVAHR